MADYTDITYLLDRSGSMSSIALATMSGYNGFVFEQKTQKNVEGKARLSLIQFDDQYEVNYLGMDIKEVPALRFYPRGMTALLDAIGKAITDTGARFAAMPEKDRPSKVVFVIHTDGHENASKRFTHEQVRDMIAHQKEKYSWEFIFLGANQDAVMTAASYGISKDYAMTFAANDCGTNHAYTTLSSNMGMLRSSEYVVGKGFFNEADRAAQTKAGA